MQDEESKGEDDKGAEELDAVDADDDDEGRKFAATVGDVTGALEESGNDDVPYNVEEGVIDEDGAELEALGEDEDHRDDGITLLERVVESTGALEDSRDEEAKSEVESTGEEREDDVNASMGNDVDEVLAEVTVEELRVEPLAPRSPVEL